MESWFRLDLEIDEFEICSAKIAIKKVVLRSHVEKSHSTYNTIRKRLGYPIIIITIFQVCVDTHHSTTFQQALE